MASPAADDSQSSACKSAAAAAAAGQTPLRPPEQGLKCPRCDSPNTKFCYYNNYSLSQPRHFCKTCRRYWTKGGALRNVPVGGGCRKNKKSKSSASSRLPLDPADPFAGLPEPGGLKLLGRPSPPSVDDFQLGMLPFSRLHPSTATTRFISFGDFSSPAAVVSSPVSAAATNSMVGFNYPSSGAVGVYGDMGGASSSAVMNSSTHISIASSIESLSSINQDLHWKLQQQRLAMFFGGEAHKDCTGSALPTPLMGNPQEAIPFQMAETSRAEVCGGGRSRKGVVSAGGHTTPAWFLDSSYSTVPPTTNNTNTNNNGTNSSSSNNNNSTSNWNGIPAWNDMPQFSILP